MTMPLRPEEEALVERRLPTSTPAPSPTLRNVRVTGELEMRLGRRGKRESLEVGWRRSQRGREKDCLLPGDHLGQDNCGQRRKRVGRTPFSSPFTCPLPLKFTPIPPPSPGDYSSSTFSIGRL